MASDALKECSALGRPFNKVAADMRAASPLWDELLARGSKMQKQMEAMSSSMYAFYEVLQKLADLASGARGATRDIGALLTKLAMRHRAIAKGYSNLACATGDDFMKGFSALCDDTRRSCCALERDHDKDLKKWKGELRKVNETTLKLSKSAAKKKANSRDKEDLEDRLEESLQHALEQYKEFELFEQRYLRNAMLEERKHYCRLLDSIKPVVKAEVALTDETFHLQGLLTDTELLTSEPDVLPEASEMVIEALQLDINRLFKETNSRSSLVEDAMRESDEKKKLRTSFLSLLSGDSASIAQENGEDNCSNSIGVAGSPNSLSQDAIRMEPDGSSRSEDPTPEPVYPDGGGHRIGLSQTNNGLMNGLADHMASRTTTSPIPPPPPAVSVQCPSQDLADIVNTDDLPPPPLSDEDEAFPLPPPPPPEAPTSPDLPPPPPDICSAWQPPQAAPSPTPASLPISVKPQTQQTRSRASSISSTASASSEHKRVFPPVPPKTSRGKCPVKAPVPPPERTVSRMDYCSENIYSVPPSQLVHGSHPPPTADRPISSIYFTSMRSTATPPPPPHPDNPSPTPSNPIYSSIEQVQHGMRAVSPPPPVEEPLYASIGRKLAAPDAGNRPTSNLRASYKLRNSQTDLYHQSFTTIGAVATLPRSRSIAGPLPDTYGRLTPSAGRPRSNTTCHPPGVSWQGQTQSVDV